MNALLICDSLQATCLNHLSLSNNSIDNSPVNICHTTIITVSICATILIISLYWIFQYYRWKRLELQEQQTSLERKVKQEKENRLEEQKSKLNQMLLQHLQNQVYSYEDEKKDNDKKSKEIKHIDLRGQNDVYKEKLESLISSINNENGQENQTDSAKV
jgi:hypothetical protein